MLKGYYVEKNEVKEDGLDIIKKKAPVIWFDCVNPSKKDIKELAERTGIPYADALQGLDEEERPRINLSEGYAQIILKTPDRIAKNVETVSFSIFIIKNEIITLRKDEIDLFSNIDALPKEKKLDILSKTPSHFLLFLIQEIITEYFRNTDEIEDVIEKIDSHLYRNVDDKKIIKEIFDIRKTLIYFHKSLIANREVISGIESHYLPQIGKTEAKEVRLVHNDITQLIEMTGTYREILQTSLELYMTSVSNNMNQVIKRLTVYASYVMVPTLISGIYGMNFRFMPEIPWQYGYPFALGLMVSSIIAMHTLFKRKGWI
ncbi:magnesium/cobalt transporter CorA [Candidatus Woesearchaeota archaeon]|nr:magnesium/cobalt transporter CorA [Candidatus Woesearchaeota archaeon]